MAQNETILIAPLNWGLGHATRCVPIINEALERQHKIILAATGGAHDFLKQEFPQLQILDTHAYTMKYPGRFSLLWAVFLQLPFFFYGIFREHLLLKRWIKQYGITRIISDNCYGLWNKNVESILITHQVFIQLPKQLAFAKPLIHKTARWFIHHFDACWVPDYPEIENSLAGELSHGEKLPRNVSYIGPLSRFQSLKMPADFEPPQTIPDILILISGPEPFRTRFQQQLEKQYANTDKHVLMVYGKPTRDKPEFIEENGITKVSHLSTPEIFWYVKNTREVISLAGYSTLMDLHVLEKQASLYATPGQPEQEYLVKWRNDLHQQQK